MTSKVHAVNMLELSKKQKNVSQNLLHDYNLTSITHSIVFYIHVPVSVSSDLPTPSCEKYSNPYRNQAFVIQADVMWCEASSVQFVQNWYCLLQWEGQDHHQVSEDTDGLSQGFGIILLFLCFKFCM
jgi:hypothetical protein